MNNLSIATITKVPLTSSSPSTPARRGRSLCRFAPSSKSRRGRPRRLGRRRRDPSLARGAWPSTGCGKDETMSEPRSGNAPGTWPDYNAVWRWHFYAGLFCLPFSLLARHRRLWSICSGRISRRGSTAPQTLPLHGPRATPLIEAGAAVAAVPGSAFSRYQPPATPTGAAQVVVARDGLSFRVIVHPGDLRVMSIERDNHRFMELVAHLHRRVACSAIAGPIWWNWPGSWGVRRRDPSPGSICGCRAEPDGWAVL